MGALLPFIASVLFASQDDASRRVDWPSFRGPSAGGVAEGYEPPQRWDVTTGAGVKWKKPIPGLGLSSPVLSGNRVYVTTAVRRDGKARLKTGLYGDIRPVEDSVVHDFQLICLDKRTGDLLWTRTAHRGVPRVKRHPKSSHANPTPATDGKRIVAFFGSEGLYCYSKEGELLWKKDLGHLDSGYFRATRAQWGFASSPVLHGGKVIVQCDVQKDSFLAAFDVKDGRELWRTRRNEVPTWSTPAVFDDGKRIQVIVNGYRHIGGYDAGNGKELWKLRGGGDIPVPTPVMGGGLVFITNAHGGQAPIYAVRASLATGDITPEGGETSNAFLAWSTRRGGNYMQTPLVYGRFLYCCSDGGILGCYEAATGNRRYRERVGIGGGGGYTASIVAADGKLYVTSEEGRVSVLRTGPAFERLATNELGEQCMATPAISEGVLYFRTRRHLIAVSKESE